MTNHVTITGRLGDDVELRFSGSGVAVANGRVAHTPRKFNQQAQQFEDAGETLWLGFSIWDRKAEALAEAAHKGDLVTVTGTLIARSWEKDGQTRTVTEIKATDVAVVPKVSAQPRQPQQPQSGAWGGQQPQQPATDPWNQGQQQQWGGQTEKAPF